MSDTEGLSLLGKQVNAPTNPLSAQLDRIPTNFPIGTQPYVVRLVCPEFTSLCPATAQPDFAHIVLDYIPDRWLIESKAYKLFMASFRNHQSFHEKATMLIADRLMLQLNPIWLRVCAFWYPRGGIPIDVFWQNTDPPKGVYVPEPGVPGYRGRG